MADIQQSFGNTAAQVGQASTMKKYNEIPLDVLPNDSFARLYAPGTRTLAAKNADEASRQYGQTMQEDQRQFDTQSKLNQDKFDYQKQQDAIAAQLAYAKLITGGTGGSNPSTKVTAGNPQAFADAVKGMNQGHTWWQQAQDSTNKTGTPQDYAPYINEQLTYGERTGMPLSEAEIKALQDYATKLFTAETSMLNGYKGGSGATDTEALLAALQQ